MKKDTQQRVKETADALLYEGIKPTQQLIRDRIGQGSLTTINKALNQWWSELGERMRARQSELPLPEPLESMMVEIWQTAVTHAEHRFNLKQQELKARAEQDRQLQKVSRDEQLAVVVESQAKLDRAYARIEDQQLTIDRLQSEKLQLEEGALQQGYAQTELQRECRSLQAVIHKLESKIQSESASANKRKPVADLFDSQTGDEIAQALAVENANLKKALDQMDAKYVQQLNKLELAHNELKALRGQSQEGR